MPSRTEWRETTRGCGGGEWQTLGESSPPSEEVFMPSMTKTILEDEFNITVTPHA